jgi:hypothetical protein
VNCRQPTIHQRPLHFNKNLHSISSQRAKVSSTEPRVTGVGGRPIFSINADSYPIDSTEPYHLQEIGRYLNVQILHTSQVANHKSATPINFVTRNRRRTSRRKFLLFISVESSSYTLGLFVYQKCRLKIALSLVVGIY